MSGVYKKESATVNRAAFTSSDQIADMVATFDDLPKHLVTRQDFAFWVTYYGRRRRPKNLGGLLRPPQAAEEFLGGLLPARRRRPAFVGDSLPAARVVYAVKRRSVYVIPSLQNGDVLADDAKRGKTWQPLAPKPPDFNGFNLRTH